MDGDKVYAMGGKGTLVCLSAADGKEIWRTTMDSLGGKVPGWGYCESPLVDGNLVIVTPGGAQGTLAAFDKATGKKSGSRQNGRIRRSTLPSLRWITMAHASSSNSPCRAWLE